MRDFYKKALHHIMTTDEIDKIIANTRGRERRKLKAIKKTYNEIVSINNYENIPVWLTLMQIDSALLLQDILAFMFASAETTKPIEKEDYSD